MQLEPFALERYQSVWENRVAWNLSESGVHPLKLGELVTTEELRDALLDVTLGYPQTNGTPELRALIAALYPGATPAHVLVTNGGSEANCVLSMRLVQPGDEVVLMTPNYLQVRGLARGLGATVREWRLVEPGQVAGARWRVDLDALRQLVTPRTRAIMICNPNNPTGARFGADALDEICAVADAAGAWIISDEIYRGAERDADETPTVWGRSERAIVTGGLSKAYGLPGLRIGWAVAPAPIAEDLWGVHDYTTIAPGAVNDRLARLALDPGRRAGIIARARGIIRTNYALLTRWIDGQGGLTHAAPDAGAIAFVRYTHPIPSLRLVERLRDEQGVLVVPGSHFDMDGYLRIGFGSDPAYLSAALARVGDFLQVSGAHAR